MSNWIDVSPKKSTTHGRNGNPMRFVVKFRLWSSGDTNKRPVVAISIGEARMKQARFVIGDQVKLLVDPQANRALLKRVIDGTGFTLSPGGTRKGDAGRLKGQTHACSVRIPIPSESTRLMLFQNGVDLYEPAFIEATESGVEFSTK
jgi:hypothetical protein